MRRVILIAIGLTMSFVLGYWVSKFVAFAEAMGKDQIGPFRDLKVDSKEDFKNFLQRFNSDSLFQLERIQFPLKSSVQSDIGEFDPTLILKRDWKIIQLFANDQYRPQIYDNYQGELRDTNERLFSWEGIENGIRIEYKFIRIESLWYLSEYNDFSD